ncbi:hypothetical protein HC928_08085 [bacterium]|nr:hypothetical protein [bacterium]
MTFRIGYAKIDSGGIFVVESKERSFAGIWSVRHGYNGRRVKLRRATASVGLSPSSKTPEEIALCIIAEIVAAKNKTRRAD